MRPKIAISPACLGGAVDAPAIPAMGSAAWRIRDVRYAPSSAYA